MAKTLDPGWDASAWSDPSTRVSLLPIVERVDNGVLPSGPFGPSEHLRAWEERRESSSSSPSSKQEGQGEEQGKEDGDELLIPFYLSAPTHIPGSVAIGPVGPPPAAARSRRTSSSASAQTHRKHHIAPLSHYLSTFNADDGGPSSSSSSSLGGDVFSNSISLLPKTGPNYPPDRRLLESSAPIGFLRPAVVRAMIQDSERMVQMRSRACWKALYPEAACTRPSTPTVEKEGEIAEEQDLSPPECGPWCLAFEDWINEEEARKEVRSEHVDRLIRNWKQAGMFPDVLMGWRDEHYDIYGPADLPKGYPYTTASLRPVTVVAQPMSRSGSRGSHRSSGRRPSMSPTEIKRPVPLPLPSPPGGPASSNPGTPAVGGGGGRRLRLPGGNVAFTMERAGTALFGFLTFGVHLTAYVKKDKGYQIWVPRRSSTKQTWPSLLDNTVAGGITAGDSPGETIKRECLEEASLGADVVGPRIRSVGLLSYLFRDRHGWLQPEVQYLYDLELPDDVRPAPNDGEATDFRLVPLFPSVVDSLWAGEWKPNCALAVVDFMVRHGEVGPERDARYLEVCTRMRSPPRLPGPA